MLLMVMALAACHGYKVHPGAVNTFDSKAYDSLLVAQSVIKTARTQFDSGALDAKFKPAVNKLVERYNEAMPAYKAWHTAMESGAAMEAEKLEKLKVMLAAVDAAVLAFQEAK